MKRSTKAALLSGLVFPGAGHLYLKRFAVGIILSVGAAAAIYYNVSTAMDTALRVAEEIQHGSASLTVEDISVMVAQQSQASSLSTNIATTLLVVFWIAGIVDSYRTGRSREKNKQ